MSGAIQLTEVDFQQIKDNLINYLKSTREFTDFDFDGSNLQVILNLLAYQQQLNAYTTNMLANETFLTSSSVRNNVVANARMLGYLPNSTKAASTHVDMSFQLTRTDYPQGFPRFLEIRPGVGFTAGAGQGSFIFNIIDIYTAAVSSDGVATFRQVDAYEGAYVTATFTVDYSNYTHRYILENPNIDTNTIRVEVQENPNLDNTEYYVQAKNLVDINETDRVYWIDEDEVKQYELTFGDGYFGKKLPDGAKIHVTYVQTNGSFGNGVQGTNNFNFVGNLFDSNKTKLTSPANITYVETSNGGAELEEVPSIKFRAPKYHGAQNRCVTATDYEAIVRKIYPSVDGIYVYGGETLEIAEYGRVYIAIKPLLGETLSNITKNYIKKSLEDYRIASLDICIVDPNVLYAEVDSLVYYDEKRTIKDTSAIDCTVTETLLEYAKSLNISKFGGAVRYSRIVGAIDDSDDSITRNLTQLRMRKDVKALMNTRAVYEVCFENAFQLDCNRSVVFSTYFYLQRDGVADLETKYYIEDDPQSGKRNDYEVVKYTELSEDDKDAVKALMTPPITELPNFVFVNKDTGEIFLEFPLGKLRLFYINSINQKVYVDNEIGTVDYDKGELKIGYEKGKDLTVIDTEIPNGVIEFRAFPREQDIIAKHSVYLSLDIAKSSIEATPDTKIGEP
jgi:hypothetical protein